MPFKSNINQFLKDTNKAIEKQLKKQQKVGKQIVLEAYSGVVRRSPVDSGLFKSSHIITLNKFTDEIPKDVDRTREIKEQAFIQGLRFSNGDKIVIQSNLLYSEKLESGHSKQAPAGIYAITEAQVKRFLNQRIK